MMIMQRTLAIAIASLALTVTGCDRPNTSDTARSDSTLQKSPSDYNNPQTSASGLDSKMGSGSPDTSSTGSVDPKMGQAGSSATAKTGEAMDKAIDKAASVIDDATVTAKVKAALIAEPGLESMEINVDTQDGVVTLAGNVDSKSLGDRAVQLASATSGVRQVVDKLVAKTS